MKSVSILLLAASTSSAQNSPAQDQVYVHIKGGTWSERRDDVHAAPSAFLQAGSVGRVDAGDTSDGYEWGNTGDTTIEFVLVTIK